MQIEPFSFHLASRDAWSRKNSDVRSIWKWDKQNMHELYAKMKMKSVAMALPTYPFALDGFLCDVMLLVAGSVCCSMSDNLRCGRNAIRSTFARNLNQWLQYNVESTVHRWLRLSNVPIRPDTNSSGSFVSAANCAAWLRSIECNWAARRAVSRYSKMENDSVCCANVSISVQIRIYFASAPCDSNQFCLLCPSEDFGRSFSKWHCSAEMPYSMASCCRLFSLPCHRWNDVSLTMSTASMRFRLPSP